MPYSNISSELADAALAEIIEAFALINERLPFLINLTKEERQSLYKMGPDAKSYVDKTKDYTASNPNLIPGFASLPEFLKDYALYAKLATLIPKANALQEAISDTMIGLGSEQMDFMTSFYSSAQEAAKRNVAGANSAADDLGTFFDRPDQPDAPPVP